MPIHPKNPPHAPSAAHEPGVAPLLRVAKRLHRAAVSSSLVESLPVLRRLLAAQVIRGLTLPQLALGYVRSRWFVGATLIGATTMAQLEEDIAAAQFSLDEATLAEIAEIQLRYPNPGM